MLTWKTTGTAFQLSEELNSGVGVNTPVMCRVRERITRHGGETFDAPGEWARWHTEGERERRQQDNAVLVAPEPTKKVEKIRGFQI